MANNSREVTKTGSSAGDVQAFLQKAKNLQRYTAGRPRLIFAIDATASRQPTWDLACALQADMFNASADVADLSLQLAYYRGLNELSLGAWETDARAVAHSMSQVQCAAGATQIRSLLKAVLSQQSSAAAKALVFIGDAVEESSRALIELAGQCRMRSLPLFMFQEGGDPSVEGVFREMAGVSGGAYASFDAGSAQRLRELLGAVARYAAGGRAALENNRSATAQRLLAQLKD